MICVYKILSPDLQECYVGSTTDYNKRIANHKLMIRPCTSKILLEKYGFDNCKFVVLEQCTKEERKIKEQWWQDHSVGLVNKRNAIVICDKKDYDKKWYEANKEKRKEQAKKVYEAKKLKSI
jgi:predicted GIY-YIG superfamily endonuclease